MAQPLIKLEIPLLKVVAGLLAILFGGFGLHKFLLGYTVPGLIMLLTTVVGVKLIGALGTLVWIIGIIEGVLYLLKTPNDFRDTYVSGNRPWF